jgi:hypothetical protein
VFLLASIYVLDMREEMMKISLLLHSVSQDQSTTNEDVAFYGWMHGPASGGDGDNNFVSGAAGCRNRLPKYSLRKESWGGVLVFGPTQAVYQLDDEAYELMTRMRLGESLKEIVAKPGAIEVGVAQVFASTASILGLI